MITYDFEKRGKQTLYEFLYQNIKQDILQNRLKADEKLPSKRTLARHLNISVITVENAYAQLLVEGYIYSIEKKGYYVSAIENMLYAPAALTPQSQRKKSSVKPSCFADFHSNSINFDNFPFSLWSKLMRESLAQKDKQLLQSVPFNGLEQLRAALADYLYHFRGMIVDPDQIIIGAGTEYLYGILIQLLGRNKIFSVEDPGYKKIASIYKSHDVLCKYISLDSNGLSTDELAKNNVDVVHISPSHHFPTGIVMPIKRRQELLSWANESGSRYIIEDDYDSEFRFTGRPIQTIQSIDTGEKVIYMNTFSKSLAPSIRISYMILPVHLMEKYRNTLSFYSCTVSSFEQNTLADFIAKGYFEQHINRMRNFYRMQRNLVIKAIHSCSLDKKVMIMEENAGLHFLLKIHTDISDEAFMEAAAKKGIRVSFLSHYFQKSENAKRHILVINYSGIETEKIEESIKRLAEIIS